MKSRIVTDKDPGMVKAILAMEDLFPKKVGYGEWDVWDNLQNLNNMNIIVEDDDGNIIGYTLCIPQVEAVEYLKDEDPLMTKSIDMAYVDQVAILKECREGSHAVLSFLLEALMVEGRKKGYKKWSSHIVMGLNLLIERIYKSSIIKEKTRTVKMPSYDCSFVYMEGVA